MDILQELPLKHWPILQKKLRNLWPINVPGYYTLHTNLKYPNLREAFKFKVYCPYGNIDNGFIGISIKGSQDCILFSTTEDTSKLEDAILKTKLIDWSNGVGFDLLTSLTLKSMDRIKEDMNFAKYDVGLTKMYLLEGNTKPFTDFRLPDNSYIASVKQHDIPRVDDTWPYKYSDSHFYFTTLASNGLSYGLYSHTDELLAWVFINEYNFLCHLYCEESYRRKGYAECVMKWAVNEQLKNGNDVYAYVVEGNEKPLTLFRKMGFKEIDDSAFLYVEKLNL